MTELMEKSTGDAKDADLFICFLGRLMVTGIFFFFVVGIQTLTLFIFYIYVVDEVITVMVIKMFSLKFPLKMRYTAVFHSFVQSWSLFVSSRSDCLWVSAGEAFKQTPQR